MKEKRKDARIPITAKVSKVEQDNEDFYFTKDLSVGGLFLVTEEDIPIGTEICLELAIAGVKNLLKVKGKVVRKEEKDGKIVGFGVQFVDVDSESSEDIEGLLKG